MVMGGGQDILKADGVPTVTLSVCTEQTQQWAPLVSVPVTIDDNGAIQIPIAETIAGSPKQAELAELTQGNTLFSVKKEFDGATAVTTYLPLRDIHFRLGKAEPVDPAELTTNVKHLADKFRTMIDGTYRCIRWQETRPVIYVVGHTDTVGSEKVNQRLSHRRAHKIAQAMKAELKDAAVQICSTGVGESQAGTADNIPFPEARRATVMTTSEGEPFRAKWRCLREGKGKR